MEFAHLFVQAGGQVAKVYHKTCCWPLSYVCSAAAKSCLVLDRAEKLCTPQLCQYGFGWMQNVPVLLGCYCACPLPSVALVFCVLSCWLESKSVAVQPAMLVLQSMCGDSLDCLRVNHACGKQWVCSRCGCVLHPYHTKMFNLHM
jgi:hypothetical protein